MGFEAYHPAINLIYFAAVIAAGFLFKQPVFLAISFLGAFSYSVKRNGSRSLIFNFCLIPLIGIFASYYSGYHHFGMTELGENFIGNKMTLESILCGLTLGMTAAVFLMWMSCVHSVFTADKIVYLFGKVSPHASLFLAIILRMVPRCKVQLKKIGTARKSIGRGMGQGNFFQRIWHGIIIFSMLVTWLLESFTGISESMRSRGYGLKGRTAFSIYRFDNRDRFVVIGIFACMTTVLMAYLLNQTGIIFDPRIIFNPITPLSYVFYGGYLALCVMPLSLELTGEWIFRKKRATA